MKSIVLFRDFFASAKKPRDRKQLQEPLLRKGFLKISPKGRGIRAFEARMHPNGRYFLERSPLASARARTLRGGFCFWGLDTE